MPTMSAEPSPKRTVLAPRHSSRSRLGRLLGPFALIWFFVLALVVDVLPRIAPASFPPPEGLLHDLLLVVAVVPLVFWLLSLIVGPRGRFRLLFEREQPRAVVDASAILLKLPKSRERILVHNAIGGLRPRSRLRGGFLLTDPQGGLLARIPSSLVMAIDQATGRHTSLAMAVVSHRPDRYVALRRPFEGTPLRFRLRRPDEPETDWAAMRAAGRRIVIAVFFTAAFAVAVLVGMMLGKLSLG
jgi:hypothetical protein